MSQRPTPHCPICEAEVAYRSDNEFFPFCSKRCKREDLGKWLGGNYAVAGRPASPHEIASEIQRGSDDH